MKNDLRPINTIPNFKRFCMTIGELPTSYLETMTYYEMLVWFTEYMKNTIIPTINNNGLAVKELQDKYIELKTYVDNYFTNLDVQQEINNKLDEMAKSGELTDIIAQYLGLAGMIVFDNVADMKLAENLVNGSKVSTMGYYQVNDGGNALYKVRTITNKDIVDEKSIIALYNNNLVAVLISNININVKQFGAYGDGIHDDTSSLQTAIDYCTANKLNLIINSCQNYYKITKPLKILCAESKIGYWGGTGLTIHGENKGNCRIIKIGNFVYTDELETEFNNKNAVIIATPKSGNDAGTGVTIENLSLENYANEEFTFNNTSYGLYTKVSRSTYKNINIKSYNGIHASCFSCLFENLYFVCIENAFYIDNGTSNTFRFMYTNSCLNPYTFRSQYSTLLSVCGDACTGKMFQLSGMGLSLIDCGSESPNIKTMFEILSSYTNIRIDGFYMFRQIGEDDNETNIDQCCIVNALNLATVSINNLSINETKHLTGNSYIFNVPNTNSYLNSNITNIRYQKNYDGASNERIKLWKTRPAVFSSQEIKNQTLNVNYLMTSGLKMYPFIGGYYDNEHDPVKDINESNISKTKTIWLDCKDKYHNENGDDIRYLGKRNVGDLLMFNDPLGNNSFGLVITKINASDSWNTSNIPIVITGTSQNRPTTNLYKGLQYFDETLNKPIWYNGSNWVDSTGTSV